MTVVKVLDRYAVSSGYEYVSGGFTSRSEIEDEFDVDIPESEDPFDYIFMEKELVGSDKDFIEAMLDRRDGNWLVHYNEYAEDFILMKIDGRTVS